MMSRGLDCSAREFDHYGATGVETMSTRTVVEINHDYLSRITLDELIELWLKLRGGHSHKRFDEMVSGIRFIGQRHHSESITITVE